MKYGSSQYLLLGVADPELPDFLVFPKKKIRNLYIYVKYVNVYILAINFFKC